MAGWPEKSAGIPVIDIGVPAKKKDRGDLYAESLQGLDEQGLAPDQRINSNPIKNEATEKLRQEIYEKLSTTEKQSLKHLKEEAFRVQNVIEKVRGTIYHPARHNEKRGALAIEPKWKNVFSLTSFGQTTEFHYIKEGDSEKFSFIPPWWYRIVTNNPEGMIRLINFVNFSKDFIKDNMQDISSQSFYASRSFYENNGDILFNNETNKRGVKVLKSEHNFFPQSTREIVSYLNSLYREELYNQKNGPFPPK